MPDIFHNHILAEIFPFQMKLIKWNDNDLQEGKADYNCQPMRKDLIYFLMCNL